MLTPEKVIDEYYLEFRCKLLELGAIMDRLDRAVAHHGAAKPPDDLGWTHCLQALEVLNNPSSTSDRAEKIALIFSEAPIHE